MNCPYCEEYNIDIDTAIQYSLNYEGSVKVATPCCKKPLAIKRKVSYRVEMCNTSQDEDDWGTPYNKGDV